MIDLVLEGEEPSTESVCVRANISQASLFRYFETIEELRQAGIARYFERFSDLFTIPKLGIGPFDLRVKRLVTARLSLHSEVAPMSRFARRQAFEIDALAEAVDGLRSTLTAQLAEHFAPELEPLTPDERRQRLAVVAALTSFETWEQLAPLGPTRRRAATIDAITVVVNRNP